MNSHMNSVAQQMPSAEEPLEEPIYREVSLLSLLLRLIPLATSFILFVVAISIDPSKWGNSFLQVMIATAIVVGAIGIGLFFPKRL